MSGGNLLIYWIQPAICLNYQLLHPHNPCRLSNQMPAWLARWWTLNIHFNKIEWVESENLEASHGDALKERSRGVKGFMGEDERGAVLE
jgi:hypothetical protein